MFELEGDTREYAAFLKQWKDDTDYIVAQTSGSTGTPKTIRLSKADMFESAVSTLRFFGIDSSSVLACPLSVNYIAGKMMLVRAATAQCLLACITPSTHLFVRHLPHPVVDLLAIVPSQAKAIIAAHELPVIRNIIIGGAPLDNADEQDLLARGLNAYVTYGMTETCSHVALRRIGQKHYEALDGISFDVDSDSRLIIRSENRKFKILQTNDLVELISSRAFVWKGRADNVINSGGIKICTEVVEEQIKDLIPGAFYIVGRPHAKWGSRPVLVLEGPADDENDEAVMEQIKGRLTKIEMPQSIERVAKISRTANGKIIRK